MLEQTHNSAISRPVIRLSIDKMVLDANVLTWEIPTPRNRLDNFEVTQETVCDIESCELGAKNLERGPPLAVWSRFLRSRRTRFPMSHHC